MHVDVLGQVCNVGEVKVLDVKGKPTKKVDFKLRDIE